MLHLILNGEVIANVYPGGRFSLSNGDIVSPAYAGWSNGEYSLAEAPAPDPEVILQEQRQGMSLSFAQLLIGLVSEGWISQAEGEAWLAGTLPAQVTMILSALPAEQQFAAKARALRPSVVQRMDPLVLGMMAAANKTAEQLDTFFMTYSAW